MTNHFILYGSEGETTPVKQLLNKYGLLPHLAEIALGPQRDCHPSFSIDISTELMQTGIAAVSAVLTDRRHNEIEAKAVFTRPGSKLTGFNGFGPYVRTAFTNAVRQTAKSLAIGIVEVNPTLTEADIKFTHSFTDATGAGILSIVGTRLLDPVTNEGFSFLLDARSLR